MVALFFDISKPVGLRWRRSSASHLAFATLIIVNSVMAGFAAEMHERLHGLASDILIECHASGGLPDPEMHLQEIKNVLGDRLVGSSASVHVPGMLGIEFNAN